MTRAVASLLFFAGLSFAAQDVAPKGPDRESPAQVVERIKKRLNETEERFERQQSFDQTMALQRKVIEDIDKLLDPPSGENSSSHSPKTSSQETAKPFIGRPNPKMLEPAKKGAATESAANPPIERKQAAATPADDRGNWGHDWRTTKQRELDRYGGQRPVRKYEQIIDEYYRRVAESGRGTIAE